MEFVQAVASEAKEGHQRGTMYRIIYRNILKKNILRNHSGRICQINENPHLEKVQICSGSGQGHKWGETISQEFFIKSESSILSKTTEGNFWNWFRFQVCSQHNPRHYNKKGYNWNLMFYVGIVVAEFSKVLRVVVEVSNVLCSSWG